MSGPAQRDDTPARTRPRSRPDRFPGTAELGLEPPIAADGEAGQHDRRALNLRWLAGTVLAGFSGLALIGSAIWISLDGDITFAESPEAASPAATRGSGGASTRRGDRLVASADIIAAKQSFKAPTTIRVGDREVIKLKPFVRVATNLALGSVGFAADVPPFNPFKLYAEGAGGTERPPEIEPTDSEAEVSVVKAPLALVETAPEAGATLSDAEVRAQVDEETRAALATGRKPTLPIPPQLLLTRTLQAPNAAGAAADALADSFSSIEVRVVPENVTVLPKPEATQLAPEERVVTIKRGETFEQVLRANGATNDQVRGINAALSQRLRDAPIREGARLKLLRVPPTDGAGPLQLARIIVYEGETPTMIAAADDRGAFVSIAPPRMEAEAKPEEEDEEDSGGGGLRLYQSLYETALKHDLPRPVIDDMVRTFAYDVDFQRRVGGGDGFEVFYTEDEEDRPDVLYVSLTVGGVTRRYYRFHGENGQTDYYDETGKSNKKFLMRKPITEAVFRSSFGLRYHPILRYSKMHTGVDWAGKSGTPILAAGDGVVVEAGWAGGYGRHTEIQHANGYLTTYSHQSSFARGIKEGARVRQGQVIGYVGTTGLSTGPHLHYEVKVNDRFVDPMQIKVPRGQELDGRALAEFRRERERVDALIKKAPTTTRLAEQGAR